MYHPIKKLENYIATKANKTVAIQSSTKNLIDAKDLDPDEIQKYQDRLKKVNNKIMKSATEYGLDAIMNLSGSETSSIRAISFATLSKLANHSSKYMSVKA